MVLRPWLVRTEYLCPEICPRNSPYCCNPSGFRKENIYPQRSGRMIRKARPEIDISASHCPWRICKRDDDCINCVRTLHWPLQNKQRKLPIRTVPVRVIQTCTKQQLSYCLVRGPAEDEDSHLVETWIDMDMKTIWQEHSHNICGGEDDVFFDDAISGPC